MYWMWWGKGFSTSYFIFLIGWLVGGEGDAQKEEGIFCGFLRWWINPDSLDAKEVFPSHLRGVGSVYGGI